MGRLEKKIAIVTGAGSVGPGWGNGRATTVRMIEEGACVFAVDLDPASLEETVERAQAPDDRLRTYQADVTSSAAVKAMVDACLDASGGSTSWSTTSAARCPAVRSSSRRRCSTSRSRSTSRASFSR